MLPFWRKTIRMIKYDSFHKKTTPPPQQQQKKEKTPTPQKNPHRPKKTPNHPQKPLGLLSSEEGYCG